MKVTVDAEKKYDVITEKSYKNLNSEVKKVTKGSKILVVTDSNVEKLYLSEVLSHLDGYKTYSFVITAGEKSKNFDNYLKIINFLLDNGFHREDTIIALGGGVVGDLTGFVASTFMRGITFIQCPTTLLAGVDSSVGGKTGVDLDRGKNLVGSFYQPSLTYINIATFSTLPEREITCGMGEVIKYAYISKSITKELLSKGITEELVLECVKIKAEIVKEDEFDKGKRALLNLGHTIGHAIETLSNYSISHGLAVIKGINKIIEISKKYYSLDEDKISEFKSLLNFVDEDTNIYFSKEKLLEKIALDKKGEKDGVNFLLIKDVGKVEIVKLTKKEIEELM